VNHDQTCCRLQWFVVASVPVPRQLEKLGWSEESVMLLQCRTQHVAISDLVCMFACGLDTGLGSLC
jgi:hypothetical protein